MLEDYCDPLVPSQGINQAKTRPWTIARPAFLLYILEFRNNEILMGAPVGCPNRRSASRLKCCGN
jgi:hypothetical protein